MAYFPRNFTRTDIVSMYRSELGREPSDQEIQGWIDWGNTGGGYGRQVSKDEFANSFRGAAQNEIKGTLAGEAQKMIKGDIPGYDEGLQKQAIEKQYEEASQSMANQLAESAAGGGFETGGYYASIAKGRTGLETAKINTLADLNNAITQYKTQLKTQGLELLGNMEQQNYTRTQAAAEQAAYEQQLVEYRDALKKQQENWWQAPLGALVGGVAGSWLGPGGFWAGATAGGALGAKAAGTTTMPTAPTAPAQTAGVGGYYSPSQMDYSYLWRK